MNVALRSDSLNFISLCSGGGGLDFGVELAIPDARPVVLVEGEAWSVATLVQAMEARLMAPAPVWSNVRTFDGRPWRGLVDGLIGGIPCQPHSLAGRRRGQQDGRDLWSPTRTIITHARPWFVLIENVPGMLSPGADEVAGAERVWRDLQRLGFQAEVGLFTAEEVGASHERGCVFILGVADGNRGQSPIDLCVGRDAQQKCETASGIRRELEHTDGAGLHAGAHTGVCRIEESRRPRHGESERSGEPMVDAISSGHDGIEEVPIGGSSGRTFVEWPGGNSFPALYPPGPSDIDSWRRVLAHSPHLEPAVRRMADGVAARLDLSGPHAARIERLRMLGNGVVPLEAAYALRTLASRLARRSVGAERLVRMMVET